MKKLFTLLFLLMATNVFAAPPSRVSVYVSGEAILASEVTGNEDAIFNYLQGGVDFFKDGSIVGADVSATANIQSTSVNLSSIAQDVGITSAGSLTNGGATTLNGAVTLGDAIADTLVIDAGAWTLTNATTFTLTGALTFSGTIANLGIVTTADINGGTMDGVQVGGTTATGELLVNDSNDDADGLGSQGTSGQVLTSAGTGANPTWSTPGLRYVDSQSVSNGTSTTNITIESNKYYKIFYEGNSDADQIMYLRFNDANANYINYDFAGADTGDTTGASISDGTAVDTDGDFFGVVDISTDTTYSVNIVSYIVHGFYDPTGAGLSPALAFGQYTGGAGTSIELAAPGNFDAKITVYEYAL